MKNFTKLCENLLKQYYSSILMLNLIELFYYAVVLFRKYLYFISNRPFIEIQNMVLEMSLFIYWVLVVQNSVFN